MIDIKSSKGEATWAFKDMSEESLRIAFGIWGQAARFAHWSRFFEYPWVIRKGDFKPRQYVLDAAGGDGQLQSALVKIGCSVVNVDIDLSRCFKHHMIQLTKGDLRQLPYPDGMFHRVVCVSVLEHIVDPIPILDELWRVLSPGGKLLVSLDVANYVRWNHTIDETVAAAILRKFNLEMPMKPTDVLSRTLSEEKPDVNEPKQVNLKVLCFCCEKAD